MIKMKDEQMTPDTEGSRDIGQTEDTTCGETAEVGSAEVPVDGADQKVLKDMLHGGNWKTPRRLRRRKQEKRRLPSNFFRIAAVAMTLLFLLTAILAVLLYLQLTKDEKEYREKLDQAEQENSVLEVEKSNALSEIASMEELKETLRQKLESMERELKEVKAERDDLLKNDETVATLTQRITELEAQIQKLKEMLDRDDLIDIRTVVSKVETVQQLLQTGAPMQTVTVTKYDKYGNPYYEQEQVYPNISLVIADTKTGYSYAWENGKVYDTGEFKNMLLALAILECATKEQASLSSNNADAVPVYDLEEQYVLKQEDIVAGSGILKNADAGTVYTYLELIEIMLTYNDVTAYERLSVRFGEEPVELLLADMPGLSTTEQTDKWNASDVFMLVRRVNQLIGSSSPYASRMKQALLSAIATYYSQSVSGSVGRQYSSTATGYHEAGWLFEQNSEMMIVLMSDVTAIDSGWSSYLVSLYQALNEMMLALR